VFREESGLTRSTIWESFTASFFGESSPDFWATDVSASVAFAFVASVHFGMEAMRRDLLSRVKARAMLSMTDSDVGE